MQLTTPSDLEALDDTTLQTFVQMVNAEWDNRVEQRLIGGVRQQLVELADDTAHHGEVTSVTFATGVWENGRFFTGQRNGRAR